MKFENPNERKDSLEGTLHREIQNSESSYLINSKNQKRQVAFLSSQIEFWFIISSSLKSRVKNPQQTAHSFPTRDLLSKVVNIWEIICHSLKKN